MGHISKAVLRHRRFGVAYPQDKTGQGTVSVGHCADCCWPVKYLRIAPGRVAVLDDIDPCPVPLRGSSVVRELKAGIIRPSRLVGVPSLLPRAR